MYYYVNVNCHLLYYLWYSTYPSSMMNFINTLSDCSAYATCLYCT